LLLQLTMFLLTKEILSSFQILNFVCLILTKTDHLTVSEKRALDFPHFNIMILPTNKVKRLLFMTIKTTRLRSTNNYTINFTWFMPLYCPQVNYVHSGIQFRAIPHQLKISSIHCFPSAPNFSKSGV
jgi:hypothetical protein